MAWKTYKRKHNIKPNSQRQKERNRNPNTVHGNSKHSQEPATLYQRVTEDGKHQKWGVSKDPDTRYTKAELGGDVLKDKGTGKRADILAQERQKVETDPGPLNKEPWAGAKQKK